MNASQKFFLAPKTRLTLGLPLLAMALMGTSGCSKPAEGDPNPPATKVAPANLKPYGTPPPTPPAGDPKPTSTGTASTAGLGLPVSPTDPGTPTTTTTTGGR